MAAARLPQSANSKTVKYSQNTYYKTNRNAYHHTGKNPICFHSVTKSTPKPFHSTASFYSQFYESILPFFYDKSRNRGEARCLTHPLL